MRLIIALLVCALAYGQQKVDIANRHERAFAVVPLVLFTSSKAKMGEFANGPLLKTVAWTVTVVIAGLNIWLLVGTVRSWF